MGAAKTREETKQLYKGAGTEKEKERGTGIWSGEVQTELATGS